MTMLGESEMIRSRAVVLRAKLARGSCAKVWQCRLDTPATSAIVVSAQACKFSILYSHLSPMLGIVPQPWFSGLLVSHGKTSWHRPSDNTTNTLSAASLLTRCAIANDA